MTQAELADQLGMSRGTYKNYEYQQAPSDEMLEKVASISGAMKPLVPARSAKLRVVGSVGAGPVPLSEIDEYGIYVPIEFAQPDYQGLVLGSDAISMWPYLQPGDTLVAKPSSTPRAGKWVLVRLGNDLTPVVKKMEVHKGALILRSLNPASESPSIDGATMLGVVTGLISADGRMKIGPEDSGIDERYMELHLGSRLPKTNF